MYQQLFTRLALSSSTTSEVSLPVAMQGANAAQIDVVILSLAGTSPTVTLQLQESNDLENWTNKGSSSGTLNATGYTLVAAVTAISSGYVRVKATAGGTGPVAIVNVGLNISQQ